MNNTASVASFTGVAAVNRFAERCSGNPDSRLGLGRFGAMTPIATKALGTTSRPVAGPCGRFSQSKSPPRRGIWAGLLTLSGGRQRGESGTEVSPLLWAGLGGARPRPNWRSTHHSDPGHWRSDLNHKMAHFLNY